MPETASIEASSAFAPRLGRPPFAIPLLILVGLVLLLPGSGAIPLVDRDEPRFAQATVEMMAEGSWAVPTFNDRTRFDKPPLTYWWMALHFEAFGVGEFSSRLHAILSAIGVAVVLFAWGSRLFGGTAGFWAGFAWLTCLQVLLHGRLNVADMPLLLFLVTSHWAAWERIHGSGGKFSASFWVLYLSLVLGILTKWIVAPAVLAATLGAFFLLHGRKEPGFLALWKRLQPLAGGLVVLIGVLLWAIPAWVETGGAFFTEGFREHVVERGTDPMNDRAFVPGFYFLTALLSLFPWIAWIGPWIGSIRDQWDARTAFLVSWVAGTYAMFSIAQTQLPHYVMPAFPAFVLLLLRRGGLPSVRGIASKIAFWGILGVMLLLALVASLGVVGPLGNLMDSVALILLGLAALAIAVRTLRERLMVGSLVLVALGFWTLGFRLEDRLAAQEAVRATTEVAPIQPWVACQFAEPSLVFYGQRFREVIDDPAEAAATLLASPRPGVFLLREWAIEDLLALPWAQPDAIPPSRTSIDAVPLAIPGYQATELTGFNLARFSWVEIRVFLPINPES